MKPIMALPHLFIAGAVLALGACASMPPPPTEALQAADISVANADKESAADYAPLEMRTAHEKLAAAHENAQKLDEQLVMQSRWQADEARADADLASAKTHQAKADAVNQEFQKNSNTLRQEIQRGPGG